MRTKSDKFNILFAISVLTIITLAVYWQVRNFEFINYDDDKYVSENNHILTGLTWDNVIWTFTHQHGGHWHPLTGLSHALDCELFGLKAGWHHLVNLLFHIANTLLLFAVLKQMTGALWRSAFAAALFAIHPLHVESVAWISERKDVLSTFFWILTMATYLRYVKNPGTGRYILTLVFFALGLMAKPMLVTLPFVLLLLDYWPLNRFEVKSTVGLCLFYEKIPFLILTAISSIVTFLVYKNVGMVVSIQKCPLSTRIGNTVAAYITYIGKTVWPENLTVFYPYPENKLPALQVITSAALLLVITILVIRLAAKYRYLAVGWLWYIGTLVPVIGIVQVGTQSMADRYTYVPLIGLFIIIAWGANDLLQNWEYRRISLAISSAIAILVLSLLAWVQTSYWCNSTNLFEHALAVTKGNYVAYDNLGSEYNSKGEYDPAIACYNKAIEINPRDIDAYYNRGTIYAQAKGQFDLAIADFNKAVEINPQYPGVHKNRGITYYSKGEYDLAIADYNKELEIDPKDAEAYTNRGNVYAQAKEHFDIAIADYDKAIEINPRLVEAYLNKANVCEKAGRKKEAIEAYKIFIQYAPSQYASYIEIARQKIIALEQ